MHPDELALLAAIKANPAEDLTRLVLADWLEEHEQPERAEFIRLQVEAVRLPIKNQRRVVLEKRSRVLLAVYRERWLGPWGGCAVFRRGLVHVRSRGSELTARVAAGGEEIAFAWVEELALELARGGAVAELLPVLASPWLGQIASLDLAYNRIGTAGVEAVATSPHLTRLTSLDLSNNGIIGAAGTETLATSPHLAQLTSLGLRSNEIGDEGAIALAASPHLAKLTALDLTSNGIGAAGAIALATSPHLAKLTALQLQQNGIAGEAATRLRVRYGSAVRL